MKVMTVYGWMLSQDKALARAYRGMKAWVIVKDGELVKLGTDKAVLVKEMKEMK